MVLDTTFQGIQSSRSSDRLGREFHILIGDAVKELDRKWRYEVSEERRERRSVHKWKVKSFLKLLLARYKLSLFLSLQTCGLVIITRI